MKLVRAFIYISAIVLLCGQAISQACTEATQRNDCTNPNLPLCIGGTCSACTAGNPSSCDTRDYLAPICDSTTGACMACTTGTQCDFDPTRPICLTTGSFIGCYGCINQTNECYNRTMGLAPFCYTDGHCGGCLTDTDCLMLFRSTAFICNSQGVCEVPVIGPYMIATFVIIGFVILVFVIVISIVAAKNKKNRQKRKNREAAKSERKLEMQPLRSEPAPVESSPRKSVDKPHAVAKEGDKENLITGVVASPKETKKQESVKPSSSSASSDSSSTSEYETKPVVANNNQETTNSISAKSRSSSAPSSSSESTAEEKKQPELNSGSSISSSK